MNLTEWPSSTKKRHFPAVLLVNNLLNNLPHPRPREEKRNHGSYILSHEDPFNTSSCPFPACLYPVSLSVSPSLSHTESCNSRENQGHPLSLPIHLFCTQAGLTRIKIYSELKSLTQSFLVSQGWSLSQFLKCSLTAESCRENWSSQRTRVRSIS